MAAVASVSEVEKRRRKAAVAFGVLPILFFIGTLELSSAKRPVWQTCLVNLELTAAILSGPIAWFTTRASFFWIMSLGILWLVAGLLLARRTRVGDAHWLWHATIMLIWMSMGIALLPHF